MLIPERLFSAFDPEHGFVRADGTSERRLHDLDGLFLDEPAYARACRAGNPLVYSVQVVVHGSGPGDLHIGFGRIEPGTVGEEFYMTRGHLHARRETAELYIGCAGRGLLLLQDEASGGSTAVDLRPETLVYVPGHTAHRTVNTGSAPLTYFGIYRADAGHDYAAVGPTGFASVVLAGAGGARVLPREEALRTLR
jgi:glucose-6-phosphate isomerase, archaeal